MLTDPEEIKVILATDCGSTTSKARLFKRIGGEYRLVSTGEAPTTVETPLEDVTLGIRNAIREVEELSGCKLLDEKGIITPTFNKNRGVDIYVTTSSAGGGLQMQVAGVIMTMTAESAQRVALGAGAIVMDCIAADDGREAWEKIERIRFLRPDMILYAGGTDGGNIIKTVEIAEFIKTANPQHRLGTAFSLPIVYAGNINARARIKNLLGSDFALQIVDNIRSSLDIENPEPARLAVHQLFMEHVMSHAPGYDKLMKWTKVPIMPTPAGEGAMFRTFAQARNVNLLGVGLGGATTNVYSSYDKKFVRSVSANLGMSYSICNVLKEVGSQNIMRWIPFDLSEKDLFDKLSNKMIRPTTLPQTLEDLLVEHAVAREAIRMGFEHHKSIARPLLGAKVRDRAFEDAFIREDKTKSYINRFRLDWVGGTGGLLSHAPRKVQSALILIDGFQLEGVTSLFQDSVFMIPHLGVLSTVHRKAALEVFDKDCLIKLGVCISLKGKIKEKDDKGQIIADITIKMPHGEKIEEQVEYGTIKRIPLKENEKATIEVAPKRGFKVSAKGSKLVTEIEGGIVGIIIDARGRPIELPQDVSERIQKLLGWYKSLETYPKEEMEKYESGD